MTESFRLKAGEYILESFKIYKLDETPGPQTSIDISRLIHTWSFSESMSTGYMQGSAKVFDSDRVLDEFIGEENGWLKGEEEIEITFFDFYQKPLTLKFFLYAITNLKIASDSKDNVYEYMIYFVSKEKFYGDRQLVRRSFSNGLISDYVQTIFDDYFNSDKTITIQPTYGNQNLVVPNYTPEETMHFFSRKAYSDDDQYATQTFRFFESKDGFYFGTMGWIQEDFEFEELDREEGVPVFVRSEFADQSPEGQIRMMSTLIDIEYPTYVNTIEDMSKGAYYKVTTELDYLNRTPLYTEYRHLDEYQNYFYPGGENKTRSKHSKSFVDEHMNYSRETLVFKDYKNPEQTFSNANYLRPSTFYPQIYNQKNINLYHHFNEMIKIAVYGRISITVGDFIDLILYEINYQTEDRKIDEKRSGRYIIESIENMFIGDQYTQVMMVSKSGFNGVPEKADAYENGPQTESVWTESEGTVTPGSDEISKPGQVGTPTQVSGTVNQREQDAMKYFIDKGYTPEQAAGIVANLTNESTMNPNARNPNDGGPGKDSIGLAQWNRERLDGLYSYAERNNVNPLSIEAQLGYVDYELNNNEKSAGSLLKNASNARDAAFAMTRYERFAGYTDGFGNREVRNRAADAERILKTYEG